MKKETRSKCIQIRMKKSELDFLKEKAKEQKQFVYADGRVNLSSFLRHLLLSASNWKGIRYEKDLRNLVFQIRKIGVNINQIATKVNQGYFEKNTVSILEAEQKEIQKNLKELIEELRKEHGNHETHALQRK